MRLSKKPDKAKPPAEPEWVTSRLLPDALAAIEGEKRITVLDLGPGDASTVNFLAQYNARIHFLDLLDCPEVVHPPDELTLASAIKISQRNISLPRDVRFDVILFWDYLHYLQLPMLEAMSATLQSHLLKSTRGYAFGALHSDQQLDHSPFGIAGMDKLVPRPAQGQSGIKAYPQQRLSEHFLCMRIAKATLLREGRLELLMEAS